MEKREAESACRLSELERKLDDSGRRSESLFRELKSKDLELERLGTINRHSQGEQDHNAALRHSIKNLETAKLVTCLNYAAASTFLTAASKPPIFRTDHSRALVSFVRGYDTPLSSAFVRSFVRPSVRPSAPFLPFDFSFALPFFVHSLAFVARSSVLVFFADLLPFSFVASLVRGFGVFHCFLES